MDTLARLAAPPWMPPNGTVAAVAAGEHWDAVAVQQHLGLAALEQLDEATGHRPGPIIWDTAGPTPRLYFLTATGSQQSWEHERLLTRGSYVAVPGATTLVPPGPYWVAPPDPDDPLRLVDPALLRRALDRVRTAAVAEYQPLDGSPQRMLVTSAQLYGRACIVCGAEAGPLSHAGYARTPPEGPGQLGWAVVACAEHAEAQR